MLDGAEVNPIEKDWIIRPAEAKDVDALARMRIHLQEHLMQANPLLLPMSEPRRKSLPVFYARQIEDETSQALVAETPSNGELVGMAFARTAVNEDIVPSRLGRIDDVWVEPPYRRKGVCRALVAELLVFFRQNNVEHLDLFHVVGNTQAEHSWSSLGFQPVLTVKSAKLEVIASRLHAK